LNNLLLAGLFILILLLASLTLTCKEPETDAGSGYAEPVEDLENDSSETSETTAANEQYDDWKSKDLNGDGVWNDEDELIRNDRAGIKR